MIGDNPIRRRFDWLHDQWVSFAENPDTRVLCWQLEDDELEIVGAFLAAEADDEIGELPDLFVRLSSPLEQEASYGFALRQELWRMSEELRTAEDAELAALTPWQLPPLAQGSDDRAALLAAGISFHQHYGLPGQLALFLNPSQVSDPAGFARWLLAVAKKAPAQVRFIVLDSVRKPELGALCTAGEKRVVAQRAQLDMSRALADVSRNAGGLDTPGGMFRQLFVAFSSALGRQELTQAEQLGERALTIAGSQGWHALSLPIHMALAAAYGGAKRSADAHARYLAAQKTAREGEQAGDPTCAKLRVQARMAQGSQYIADGEHEQAAKLYEETAPEALALGDARMVIDCQRLASFCREQAGDLRAALRHGVAVTQYARGVDLETRKTSTLPFVGEAMKRLAKKSELRAEATRTAREIEALMAETEAAGRSS